MRGSFHSLFSRLFTAALAIIQMKTNAARTCTRTCTRAAVNTLVFDIGANTDERSLEFQSCTPGSDSGGCAVTLRPTRVLNPQTSHGLLTVGAGGPERSDEPALIMAHHVSSLAFCFQVSTSSGEASVAMPTRSGAPSVTGLRCVRRPGAIHHPRR